MFDAILHHPWEPGTKDGEIIHHWAEDMNKTTLLVPPQIRDDIVSMQNWLCRKYQAIQRLKTELLNAERFFN